MGHNHDVEGSSPPQTTNFYQKGARTLGFDRDLALRLASRMRRQSRCKSDARFARSEARLQITAPPTDHQNCEAINHRASHRSKEIDMQFQQKPHIFFRIRAYSRALDVTKRAGNL